jgi:hypothetical protein
MGLILVTLLMLGCLAFVVWAFCSVWVMGGNAKMGVHGWIALAIAFVVTGLLGGGLMWLAFYSSRKGWDDGVARNAEDDEDA